MRLRSFVAASTCAVCAVSSAASAMQPFQPDPAHRRPNIVKRELRQRAAELAAIEETLDEAIATENRLIVLEHEKRLACHLA
jgi:hypothetical protein